MITGMRFENERIVVSDRHFERCKFVDCELVYRGGRVGLVANSFDCCRWSFEGAAADTLSFVGALCRDSDEFSAMSPERSGSLADRPTEVAPVRRVPHRAIGMTDAVTPKRRPSGDSRLWIARLVTGLAVASPVRLVVR